MFPWWFNVITAQKSYQLRSFFWFVFSCIKSKYMKIRTTKNSELGYFLRNVIKHKTPYFENEAKQKYRKFPCASSIRKIFRGFREIDQFLKSFCSFLKNFIHSLQSFTKWLMVLWWIQMKGLLRANISDKEIHGDTNSNPVYLSSIRNH